MTTTTEVDHNPSSKDLTSALHTIDNLVNLLEQVTAGQKKAVAVSFGLSADRRLTVYVTATSNVDEARIGEIVSKVLEESFEAKVTVLATRHLAVEASLRQALKNLLDVFEPVTANTREEMLSGDQVLAMREADKVLAATEVKE
jgi:ABC-type polar amino acid transport system ATPase subunit